MSVIKYYLCLIQVSQKSIKASCGILEAEIIDGQGADNFSIGQILRDFRIKVIRFEKS